jgi:uncharacterized protein (DUF342 family)
VYSNIGHQYPIQPIRQKSYPLIGQQISNNENIFQNLIDKKCSEITENENTIFILHRLVDDIERALKTVSDKIMEQCKQNNISVAPQLPDNVKLNNIEQLNEDSSESFRYKISFLNYSFFFFCIECLKVR